MSTCTEAPSQSLLFRSEQVEDTFVFEQMIPRDERVRVIWCRFEYVVADWIRVTGDVKTGPGKAETCNVPLGQFLAMRLQQFIVEASDAADDQSAYEIAALKTKALNQAEALFDQLPERLRDATLGTALLLDFVRAIELVAHLMLEPKRTEAIRISTATGGLTLRSGRTPHCEFAANRRPVYRFKPDAASASVGADVIATLFRTHALCIETELNRAIELLRASLENEGLELKDFESLMAA